MKLAFSHLEALNWIVVKSSDAPRTSIANDDAVKTLLEPIGVVSVYAAIKNASSWQYHHSVLLPPPSTHNFRLLTKQRLCQFTEDDRFDYQQRGGTT